MSTLTEIEDVSRPMKRISLMISEDQHQQLQAHGLNLSGLVRDLIDDYLSEHSITLSVSPDTKAVYDQIVSNTGSTDNCIEPYLRSALTDLLERKIKEMNQLKHRLNGK
jgi:hypothetical protein